MGTGATGLGISRGPLRSVLVIDIEAMFALVGATTVSVEANSVTLGLTNGFCRGSGGVILGSARGVWTFTTFKIFVGIGFAATEPRVFFACVQRFALHVALNVRQILLSNSLSALVRSDSCANACQSDPKVR